MECEIKYDRSGNYADSIIDATYGYDDEIWMSVYLPPAALARVRELEAVLGQDTVFLSFEERVRWALSDVSMEDASSVALERPARYSAGLHTSDIAVTW